MKRKGDRIKIGLFKHRIREVKFTRKNGLRYRIKSVIRGHIWINHTDL